MPAPSHPCTCPLPPTPAPHPAQRAQGRLLWGPEASWPPGDPSTAGKRTWGCGVSAHPSSGSQCHQSALPEGSTVWLKEEGVLEGVLGSPGLGFVPRDVTGKGDPGSQQTCGDWRGKASLVSSGSPGCSFAPPTPPSLSACEHTVCPPPRTQSPGRPGSPKRGTGSLSPCCRVTVLCGDALSGGASGKNCPQPLRLSDSSSTDVGWPPTSQGRKLLGRDQVGRLSL